MKLHAHHEMPHLKLLLLSLLLPLAACVHVPRSELLTGPLEGQTEAGATFARWRHRTFPGKQPTRYAVTRIDGRVAVAVQAESSASMLRQTLRIEPEDLGRVKFSWKVPALIAGADLGEREAADSPVRVVLAFEGDRARFSFKNAMLSELAHALTGEPMPYATLMYVWSNQRKPESVIHSQRTDRIRKLVVESGSDNLNQWLDYERDIRADYIKAFGETPGALIGVAFMTDTDNTRSSARAWYGPVRLDAPVLAKN